eukprot:Blabericola_migrator_1__6055@NODE_3053_length_2079_cov_17_164016_g1907_i0_p1_GENE_NODE_3053_length_2079_cov_17_164016_g1907_i0NODE_3053_length_2079_cov_17_164016_g1907_i0_p1_ORF_typecomplete_len173_score28_41DUF2040/PF09745_9/0_0087_NODE_3053_length_2079_cov_17_164016_g1907_i0253771
MTLRLILLFCSPSMRWYSQAIGVVDTETSGKIFYSCFQRHMRAVQVRNPHLLSHLDASLLTALASAMPVSQLADEANATISASKNLSARVDDEEAFRDQQTALSLDGDIYQKIYDQLQANAALIRANGALLTQIAESLTSHEGDEKSVAAYAQELLAANKTREVGRLDDKRA